MGGSSSDLFKTDFLLTPVSLLGTRSGAILAVRAPVVLLRGIGVRVRRELLLELLLLVLLRLLLLGRGALLLLSLRLTQGSGTLASSEGSERSVFVDVFIVAGSTRGETRGTSLSGGAQEVVETTLSLVSLLRRLLLAELVVVESVQVGAVIVAAGRSVCLVRSVRRLSGRDGRGLVDSLTEHGASGRSGRSLVGRSSRLAHRVVPLVRSGRGV
jgi:hypothetical protein